MADNIPVEGNLDLKGNQINNVAIEVVSSLPTTNNFDGRQVTYEGRSYIWNGSAWKCDADYLEIGGRNLIENSNNIGVGSYPNSEITPEGWLKVSNYNRAAAFLSNIGLDEKIANGEKVILSFKAKATGTTIPPTFYINSAFGYLTMKGTLSEDFSIFTLPVTWVSGGSEAFHMGMSTNGVYFFKEFKLEKGNIATDWSPAPEDKADENQSINFDTSNIEPTQTGTVTKTSTWLWQYLTQSVNFLWLKLKDLFPTTQATTHNYIPKIDDVSKKLVKSNINDDGSTPKYGTNAIWHSGNDGSNSGLDADLLDGIDSSGFQKIRPFGHNYNNIHSAYYSSNQLGYYRIALPNAQLNTWCMLYMELSVKQNYRTGEGGKIIINALHNSTSPEWFNFSATTIGNLSTAIKVYASEGKYFYVEGISTYSNVSVDKLLVGDAAIDVDFSSIIVDSVSSLPSVYQTAVMSYMALQNGTYPEMSVGKLDGKHAGNNNGEIPINNGTLNTNLFAEKSNKLANAVTITDFTTFNPTTLGLAVGESCNFIASAATGRPMFEVSTICMGEIQHVYSGHYIYIAYSGANTSLYPLQWAIGGYNSGFKGWQLRNAQGLLNLIKTVDGTSSGLDADLLDGLDSTDFAQLEDGKIKASNLPDYLLGQVLYGGSINSSQVCTLSSLYKDKFNTTDTTRLLSTLTASSHVGVYFIASGNFLLFGAIDVNVGDWVISDGNAWGKIDNTDAVASVNGYTGVINLHYEDLGDMPIANDVKAGGFKTGYDNTLSVSPEFFDVSVSNHGDDNDGKAFVAITSRRIKQILGVNNSHIYNGDDIFISGISTTNYSNNFNDIVHIGSYKVSGGYYYAPKPDCGTNTTSLTGSMRGTLNVFRSGANDWETIQQLFWVRDEKTEQYQRSYDGAGWTIWKRLIKCDDYADPTTGRGGIISAANISELFRAPDLIQLWNTEDSQPLGVGTYYLDTFLPIDVTTENVLEFYGSAAIINLTPERRYRVTYVVHYKKVEGFGEVTIRIRDGEDNELYSTTDYMSESDIRKVITLSVILTNIDTIRPSIEVDSKLVIEILSYSYQVIVEEIKFPQFNPNN